MKRILVGVDGSEASQRALGMAAELAARFGAAVTMVHVQPLSAVPLDGYARAFWHLEQGDRALADQVLDVAQERLQRADVSLEKKVLRGSKPAEQLAEAAIADDVDLVVVGSHGKGAVGRALLGSVSDQLAHLVSKPVLIVH